MKAALIFPILGLLLFLSNCKKEESPVLSGIQIRFHSYLDHDIEDAYYISNADTIQIGTIPANGYTSYLEFPSFTTGDGIPMGMAYGRIDTCAVRAWAGLWCGTGVDFTDLEPGSYTLSIGNGVQNPSWYWLGFE
ncbi:MAG: hypothetical protein IPL65_21425 [Lewinellaceae bacterium]|nr:hypothetical protein [Lewinellaceae bacterium]